MEAAKAAADRGRKGGTRRLAGLLEPVLGPAARKRGFAQATILTDWPRIVGPTLAQRCQPVMLRYPRGSRAAGALELRASAAVALEIQHSAPQLIERINGYFGFPAVRQLRLVQAPLPPPAPPAPPPAALSAERAAALAATVAAVTDARLREALLALGRAIARARHSGLVGAVILLVMAALPAGCGYFRDPAAELRAQLGQAQALIDAGEVELGLYSYQALGQMGSAEAYDALAGIYEAGEVVPRDPVTAESYRILAGELGHVGSMRTLAERYQARGRDREARAAAAYWYGKAAASGDRTAMLRRAELVLEDAEARPDQVASAIADLESLANTGFLYAKVVLARAYDTGRGVERDPGLAERWYAALATAIAADAERGDAMAAFRMGDLLADGRGLPADPQRAVAYYERAAAQGNTLAMRRLGGLYASGRDGFATDAEQAIRWYGEAAEHGDANASYQLARIYHAGLGVPRDFRLARLHYERAAEGGEERSWRWLGELLLEREGPWRSPRAALPWLRRAAVRGDGKAMFLIGELHEQGRLGRTDPVTALAWYGLAVGHGYSRAEQRYERLAARSTATQRARAQAVQETLLVDALTAS